MNEIVKFQPPRLPYHDAVERGFGIDRSGWKALVEAIYPSAKSVDSVVMALSYCKARNLDPFKRPVHIVPMWDSKAKAYVETVWPGIAELRTTAFRTGNYAGCDEAEFGPTMERTFTGKVKKWVNRQESMVDTEVAVVFPEWCRMTVYRELHGKVCRFVGPKVYWLEAYASIGQTDIPNDMWADRPMGQIEKCAEAAALRKAFPEEMGNDLTAEEMEGRRIAAEEASSIGPSSPPSPPSPPPAPSLTPPAQSPVIDVEATPAGTDAAFYEMLEAQVAEASSEDGIRMALDEADADEADAVVAAIVTKRVRELNAGRA